MRYFTLILLAVICVKVSAAEPIPEVKLLDGREGRPLALDQFRPQQAIKVPEHRLTKSKFASVDIHTHPSIRRRNGGPDVEELIKLMDRQQIACCVSLDGKLGEELDDHIKLLWAKHRDRFVIFATIDFRGAGKVDDPATWDCQLPEFARVVARQLEEGKKKGLSGVKLFKSFGLGIKNADGSYLAVDDPRWDPIWEACGRLGLPVIMHTADPSAFFAPIDAKNERWEELHRRPEWSFFGPGFPKREELHAARNRVMGKHPKTTFIAAHMGNDAEDLAQLGEWLDRYPNMVVETASRISELGRQPYSARKFFIKYADRIMFGTDGPWPEPRYTSYWRVFETEDEYFPYSERDFPPQGFWNIYGLNLPDDVLKKIYFQNAARLIPGVKERVEKYQGGMK